MAKAAPKENVEETVDQVVDEVVLESKTTDTSDNKVETTEVKTAKAGKRSSKAIKETEAKIAKEERKKEVDTTEKPKHVQKTRTKLDRRGKNYRAVAGKIEKGKMYTVSEAVALAIETNPVKFDATIEMHFKLGVDPRHADQNIRDIVALPAGTGKTIRVAVLADGDQLTAATKAGADIAGGDEFLQQLERGTIDFDVLIATPSMMPKLGKYARVLGPKGLMPSPKSGTVTNDVAKAINDTKAGRVEYRVDSTGIVHLGIGKVSFGAEKIGQNANAVITSIKNNKPASTKGSYLRTVYMTTAMGPSIAIDVSSL